MLQRLLTDTRGASAVEYGLIVAAVMLVMTVGLSQFGISLESLAQRIASELNLASREIRLGDDTLQTFLTTGRLDRRKLNRRSGSAG